MAVAAKTGATLTGRAGFYDYPALAGIADRLFVMAWDLHWATSPSGPISDATWVAEDHQVRHERPELLSASPSARSCTASTGRWAPGPRRWSGTT